MAPGAPAGPALAAALLLLGACGAWGDPLPINRNRDPSAKPITIWPLADAEAGHTHSPELAAALPLLLNRTLPVTDLGCGVGYYVAELSKMGYEVHGVEGTEGIEQIALHKPILQADLSEPLALDLPKGNVLTFEVAEHLHGEDEEVFLYNVASLCSARVVMSWAVESACAPGRGHGHLNCRNNDYVVRAMFRRGFLTHAKANEYIRGKVRDSKAYWFRETLLVFDRFTPPTLDELRSLPVLKKSPPPDAPARFHRGVKDKNRCRAMIKADREAIVTSPGDSVDIELTISLHDCDATPGSPPPCMLLFLDTALEASFCPPPPQHTLTHTLYGLGPGTHSISASPCLATGQIPPTGLAEARVSVSVGVGGGGGGGSGRGC